MNTDTLMDTVKLSPLMTGQYYRLNQLMDSLLTEQGLDFEADQNEFLSLVAGRVIESQFELSLLEINKVIDVIGLLSERLRQFNVGKIGFTLFLKDVRELRSLNENGTTRTIDELVNLYNPISKFK